MYRHIWIPLKNLLRIQFLRYYYLENDLNLSLCQIDIFQSYKIRLLNCVWPLNSCRFKGIFVFFASITSLSRTILQRKRNVSFETVAVLLCLCFQINNVWRNAVFIGQKKATSSACSRCVDFGKRHIKSI